MENSIEAHSKYFKIASKIALRNSAAVVIRCLK